MISPHAKKVKGYYKCTVFCLTEKMVVGLKQRDKIRKDENWRFIRFIHSKTFNNHSQIETENSKDDVRVHS